MTRYTNDPKTYALRRLKENHGDVPLTSLQTRIPERTLYDWKRKLRLQENLNTHLQQENITAAAATAANSAMPDGAHDESSEDTDKETEHEYVRFREHLIRHIDTLLRTLSDDPDLAHRRAIALTRLLDKVIALESLVTKNQPITIRYEFRQFDGSLAPTPPFQVHDGAKVTPPHIRDGMSGDSVETG
jgi:hypothetical protein